MPEHRPDIESLHEIARGSEKIASSIDSNCFATDNFGNIECFGF